MRCIIGVTLFLVLYFGGCMVLGGIAGAIAGANDPQHAQRAGRVAGTKVVKKYHALVAVGAGVVTILGCSLPTLLARKCERDAWRSFDEDVEHGSAMTTRRGWR